MMKKAKKKTAKKSRSARSSAAARKTRTTRTRKASPLKASMKRKSTKTPARSSSRLSRKPSQTADTTYATNPADESSMERSRGDLPLSFASKGNPSGHPEDEQEPEEARRADEIETTSMRRQPGSHGSRSM